VCEWILHAIRPAEHQVSFFECGNECTNLMLLAIYVFNFMMTVTFIIKLYNRNVFGVWVMPFVFL